MFTSTIIKDLIRVCPGKSHAWYSTSLGFPVRKPLQKGFDYDKAMVAVADYMEIKPEVLKQGYTNAPIPKPSKRRYILFALYGVSFIIIAYLLIF